MATGKDIKKQVQEQFGEHAQAYVTSAAHAKGNELDRLVELAEPQADWSGVDLATGGGHTALKFAPYVKKMIATDLTYRMLANTRRHILEQSQTNVEFATADAEQLPFPANVFDLVTCRIAPHHFPAIQRFIHECARVLKPQGRMILQDHVVPNHKKTAQYVNAFEKLRDPSHFRALPQWEWFQVFDNAGLEVVHSEQITKSHEMMPWAERMGCNEALIQKLQIMLVQAPPRAKEWMPIERAGKESAGFSNRHIIISARKT